MKTQIIVNSFAFRTFLKNTLQQAKRNEIKKDYEVPITIAESTIKAAFAKNISSSMPVEHKGSGDHLIELIRLRKTSKIVKHLSEQPISVVFEDGRILLTCQI